MKVGICRVLTLSIFFFNPRLLVILFNSKLSSSRCLRSSQNYAHTAILLDSLPSAPSLCTLLVALSTDRNSPVVSISLMPILVVRFSLPRFFPSALSFCIHLVKPPPPFHAIACVFPGTLITPPQITIVSFLLRVFRCTVRYEIAFR